MWPRHFAERCIAEMMTSNTAMTAPTVAPIEMSSHVNPTHRGVQHAHSWASCERASVESDKLWGRGPRHVHAAVVFVGEARPVRVRALVGPLHRIVVDIDRRVRQVERADEQQDLRGDHARVVVSSRGLRTS